MQKIDREVLARAQISGGEAKGTATATADSPMTLDLSNAKITGDVSLTLNNGATATASA
jgi:hypothetical protein